MIESASRRIKAVIFDMDGTLLDTEAVYHAALHQTAIAKGKSLTPDIFLRLVGLHREDNKNLLRSHWGHDFDLNSFYDESDALFDAMWRKGVPFRPGAVELLALLVDAGLPLALCTSSKSPDAEERLGNAGILERFDVIVTLSDVQNPKPDPEPYLLAAERLGIEPASCVVVEDSPNGLRAGVAAGMMGLLVPDLAPATEETTEMATAVLPDLRSVGEWITASLSESALGSPIDR